MVEGGQRLDEAEVTCIAEQLLGIADYLGQKRPAVIHRCSAVRVTSSLRHTI